MATSRWENDAIQFPRLLAEIVATQSLDMDALAESMGLTLGEVQELFDRADEAWEHIKDGNEPPVALQVNVFDRLGQVVGEQDAKMTLAEIADVVNHAAQLSVVHNSDRRSSGDMDGIIEEMNEAVSVSGVLDIQPTTPSSSGLLTLYARKEPTRDQLVEADKGKKDTVVYRDRECTEPMGRWPWHYSNCPKCGQAEVTLNCSRWQLEWVDPAPKQSQSLGM